MTQKYQVHYKLSDSSVWLGLETYRANSPHEAIELAKAEWIKSWNLSFPHNPNGTEEVKNYVFGVIENRGQERVLESEFHRL